MCEKLFKKNKKALLFLKENAGIADHELFYIIKDSVLYRYSVMDVADWLTKFADEIMLETNVIKEGSGAYQPMVDNTTTPPKNYSKTSK